MSESIDLRYVADNQPSLCIPRVFNNIDESRIRAIFDQLGLGEIHHIDVISRKNEKGEPFKRAYIHFKTWYSNTIAQEARRKLLTGKEIKVVYDTPWFWKVSANKWTQQEQGQGVKEQPVSRKPIAPYIELDSTRKSIAPALTPRVDEFGRSIQYRNQDTRRSQDTRRPQQQQQQQHEAKPVAIAATLSPVARNFSPVARTFEPRIPDCEPIKCEPIKCEPKKREPRDEDSVPDINYGAAVLPKKIKLVKKKPTKVVKEESVKEESVKEESAEEVKQQVEELYGDL